MLAIFLSAFAVTWGLWLAYLLRYPARWRARIDRQHDFLRQHGLSNSWMQKLEKGTTLKVIVGITTFISLMCLAVVLQQPHALDYLAK